MKRTLIKYLVQSVSCFTDEEIKTQKYKFMPKAHKCVIKLWLFLVPTLTSSAMKQMFFICVLLVNPLYILLPYATYEELYFLGSWSILFEVKRRKKNCFQILNWSNDWITTSKRKHTFLKCVLLHSKIVFHSPKDPHIYSTFNSIYHLLMTVSTVLLGSISL